MTIIGAGPDPKYPFCKNLMVMKKIITAFFGLCILFSLQNCSPHLQKKQ